MANRDRQMWRCFGCNEGGDIFDFLMKIESLEFPDALKMLAEKAGVVLKNTNVKLETKKGRLYDVGELAAKLWHKILMDSPAAQSVRDYLKQRGLSEETIEDFRLGYAPDSWDNLINFLRTRKYSDQEIFLAGLSVKKERGSGYYDRFRGRLMFPILDLSGRVAGFGGRALKAEENAKYINTPQTAVYNKSLIVYGLYQAKDAIKKADLGVLVEGYMDVIPSHQAGIKNVVAISGPALTLEQVKILKRYTNNLALALDMDAAGQMAALRSIDTALQEEMNVKVITLPFGKDPGECVKNNPDDWIRAIAGAKPIMEYFFERAFAQYDIQKPENKKLAAKLLLEKILKLGSQVERDYWLKELGQKLDVAESVLRELAVKAENRREGKAVTKGEAQTSKSTEKTGNSVFARLLASLIVCPPLLKEVIAGLEPDFLAIEADCELYKNLASFYNKVIHSIESLPAEKPFYLPDGEEFDLYRQFDDYLKENGVNDASRQPWQDAFWSAQNDFADLDARSIKEEAVSWLRSLKKNYLERKIRKLQLAMEEAEKSNDLEKVKDICSELNDLIKQKGAY